jgi:hypothetical protein
MDKFVLFVSIRFDRGYDPVRHQGLQSPIFPPRLKPGSVLQNLEQERFMIALEKDALVAKAAVDEQIDGLPRRRSAIDIIAEKDMQRSGRPSTG